MGKAYLIKRLSWYYPLEQFHAYFTFPIITIYFFLKHSVVDSVFSFYGLGLIIFILFQGQHYWKLKLYVMTGKEFNQKKNLSFFSKAKKINWLFIALMPVVFVIQVYLWQWTIKSIDLIIWAILANTFAVLEHVNYYYLQLSIDNKPDVEYLLKYKRLKVASLAKDLMEGQF